MNYCCIELSSSIINFVTNYNNFPHSIYFISFQIEQCGGGCVAGSEEKLNSRITNWWHRILVNTLVFPDCLQLASKIPNGNWYLPVGMCTLSRPKHSYRSDCNALFFCSSVFEYTQFVWFILNFAFAIRFIRGLESETLFALNEKSISIFLNCLCAATFFSGMYLCSCWLAWLSSNFSKMNNR